MIDVITMHPRGVELCGFIPGWLSEDDPRPAKDQFNEHYGFAGGWRKFDGLELDRNDQMQLRYPGDPAMFPVAFMKLRDEEIWVYPHAWVLIFDTATGKHEVARMD